MRRGEEGEAPAQEREGGRGVPARGRPATRRSEQLAGTLGERVVESPELRPVEVRLLEVVAEELVLALALLEPAGEPLVQVGARALRDRRVRRVADQRMSEPKAVVAEERGRLRADELLADEREEHLRHLAALRLAGERGDGASPELLADHACALEHLAFLGLEPVEACR